MKMMGSSQGDDLCHAGDAMKLKAYESWVLLLFATTLTKKYTTIPHADHLATSADAIIQWMDILRGQPFKVCSSALQSLNDLMACHLANAEAAKVKYVPKHHFAGHITERTRI